MLSNHHKGDRHLCGGFDDRFVALMRVQNPRGVPRATCKFFDYDCLPWHTSLRLGAARFGYLVPVFIRPYS